MKRFDDVRKVRFDLVFLRPGQRTVARHAETSCFLVQSPSGQLKYELQFDVTGPGTPPPLRECLQRIHQHRLCKRDIRPPGPVAVADHLRRRT